MANIKQAILSTLFGSGETTTVYHYTLYFTTVDGKTHIKTSLRHIDISAINCSPIEYYLIGKDFLFDNEGAAYPMNAIVKIWFECNDKKENVPKEEYRVWYEVD